MSGNLYEQAFKLKKNMGEEVLNHEVTVEEMSDAIDQTLKDQVDANIADMMVTEIVRPANEKSARMKSGELAVLLASTEMMFGGTQPYMPPRLRSRPGKPLVDCLNPPCNNKTAHKKGYCSGDCHREHTLLLKGK